MDATEDRSDKPADKELALSSLAQVWLNRALNYFTHATNESLCLSFVGLGVSTYLILGRVGLVLMGVVGGVALHAAWEGDNGMLGVDPKDAVLRKRREIGLEVVKRVWNWADAREVDVDRKPATYDHFQPETAEALKELTDAIIATNVRYVALSVTRLTSSSWYEPLVPGDDSFPYSCQKTLSAFIQSLSTHLSYKRPTNMFVDLVTNSTSIIVVFLSELAIALNANPQVEAAAAVESYLDKNPESNLARMLETTQQAKKLDTVAEDMLSNFLDPKIYDCPPLNAFLNKVLSRSVLTSVLQTCSQPEWLNEWVVYLLQDPELNVQEDKARQNIDRAEDAMEEAMREAKRLTQLIVEEEARKAREEPEPKAETPPRSPLSAGPIDASELETPRPRPLSRTPSGQPEERPALTLTNAKISIFDDSVNGDMGKVKAKPTIDYLIQIEPASSAFSGWMTARRYADFETLHEVLRRIATITGTKFAEKHPTLPPWKGQIKTNLRGDLEQYLGDALKYQPLADSEGMKRFLDKDQSHLKSPDTKGLGWPAPDMLNSMGKNMIGALTKAPKNVAGGGKALIDGVSNVLVGEKKTPRSNRNSLVPGSSVYNGAESFRLSQDSVSRQSFESVARGSLDVPRSVQSDDTRPSTSSSRNDYTSLAETPSKKPSIDSRPSTDGRPSANVSRTVSLTNVQERPVSRSRKTAPLNEQETQVTIELVFAVITELYTLSSAWNFRRTLLTAAKTFLLRPGNPQLEAIRVMIQETVIDQNCSDAGMATLIRKLRSNAAPTPAELASWPKPLSGPAKEELRTKARAMLVERGMPQALLSVMGAAASGEALGKVFDCLQIEKVARALVFGILLQALRATVQ